MIGAMNSLLSQKFYYIGMIAGPSFSIPDGIAVKISSQDSTGLFQVFFVIMNGLPYLFHILAIGIIGIICPYGIQCKAELIIRNWWVLDCTCAGRSFPVVRILAQ